MKNKAITLFALFLAVGPASALAGDPATDLYGDCGSIRRVSIYGDDNREEYCSQNILLRDLADSTAGLFSDGSRVILTNRPYSFATGTHGAGRSLAPGQRFADQPEAAYCTGFLVGENLLVTAGHCVKDLVPGSTDYPKDHAADCQENTYSGHFCGNIRVVFGFRKELGGVIPKSVPAANVYQCVEVLSHSLDGGPDYALLRLDRAVSVANPLAINRSNAGLSKNTPLFVIGHPSGIPLKIAGDATVISSGTDVYTNRESGANRKWMDNGYAFLTDLDAFHGNSGSPVFNLNTLLVEGILVKGDNDYEPHPEYPGRKRVTNYPQGTGGGDHGKGVGEVCTKISVPAAKIPATGREANMLEMNRKSRNRFYPVMLELLLRRAGQQPQVTPIPNYKVPKKPKPEVQWI